MSKLPELSTKEILRGPARFDYHPDHHTGSHIICRNALTKRIVVVPSHNPVAKGTLRAIIREAGLSREEFMNALD